MASFGVSASGGSVSLSGGSLSFDRTLVCAADSMVISGGAADLVQGETGTTIRWALVAIQLEAHSKGGVIRLQQEAKQ